MNACKTYEPLLTEALFGALADEDRRRLEAHVDACPACAEALRELRGVLDVAREPARPARTDAYWDGYYDRLTVRMAAEASASRSRPGFWAAWASSVAAVSERLRALLRPAPSWTLQAAIAVALVIVGIVLGRYVLAPDAAPETAVPEEAVAETAPPQRSTPEAPAPEVGGDEEGTVPEGPPQEPSRDVVVRPAPGVDRGVVQAAAVTDAGRYLERSKVLLLGLVNYGEADVAALDLERKRRMARELVDEARPLRRALTAADRQQLEALVADLEVILLQIANIEARHDAPAIELIKSGVDQKALLLKINIEEMRMDEADVAPTPPAVPTPEI